MEDHEPPRMHVELVRGPDTVDGRAAAVAAAGWSVSTWDHASATERDDLPLRQSRCDGLVIGQGDGRPVAPAAPTTTALTMRRYPRPAQGSCSGERTTGLLFVLISADAEEHMQEVRDWGDFVHLRHIAEAGVPGFRTITVWENEQAATPRYCHLYEMVGDDAMTVYAQMGPSVKDRLDPATYDQWRLHPHAAIDEARVYRRRS